MSNPIGDPGHGHSPAAWTAIIIMLVAITIGTFFFFLKCRPWCGFRPGWSWSACSSAGA